MPSADPHIVPHGGTSSGGAEPIPLTPLGWSQAAIEVAHRRQVEAEEGKYDQYGLESDYNVLDDSHSGTQILYVDYERSYGEGQGEIMGQATTKVFDHSRREES
jgi:hypothetical protein